MTISIQHSTKYLFSWIRLAVSGEANPIFRSANENFEWFPQLISSEYLHSMTSPLLAVYCGLRICFWHCSSMHTHAVTACHHHILLPGVAVRIAKPVYTIYDVPVAKKRDVKNSTKKYLVEYRTAFTVELRICFWHCSFMHTQVKGQKIFPHYKVDKASTWTVCCSLY